MKSDEQRTVLILEACEILHCGRSTIFQRIASDPHFPQPIRIGRALSWYAHELTDYVAACASRRVPATPAYAAERATATEQVRA